MMGVARCLFLHAAFFLSSLPHAAAIAPRQSQVSLHGLWDDRVQQELNKGAGKRSERVSLAAGGALLRSESDHSEAQAPQVIRGAVARRFMQRDGLQPAEGVHFPGTSLLAERLHELRSRCPGSLEPGWVLLDSDQDDKGGHHWVLQGPGVDRSGKVLLHVSSAVGQGPSGAHDPLRFSPRKLCRDLPASMLEQSPTQTVVNTVAHGGGSAAVTVTHDDDLDEPEQILLTNQLVVDSLALIRIKVNSKTAEKCDQQDQILNATALSASSEVSAGVNIRVVVRLIPAAVSTRNPTYHIFEVDWHVCSTCSSGFSPTLDLPYDTANKVDLGWCELLSMSTDQDLGSLAQAQGHDSIDVWRNKLGLLTGYRDAGRVVEEQISFTGKNKAKTTPYTPPACVATDRLTDTYDIRIRYPQCATTKLAQDQGNCGACWVFASMQTLAIRACMQYGRGMINAMGQRRSFSKQEIMSCNTAESGCEGGAPRHAFEEAAKGLALEDDYPYYPVHHPSHGFPWSGDGSQCKWGGVAKPFRATTYYAAKLPVEQIQQEIFCKGPTTVGFQVKANFFDFFDTDKSKVYTTADCDASTAMGWHAVTLLGWGYQEPAAGKLLYWELMNSWGEQWGNDGFFRLERGTNTCSLETEAIQAGDLETTTGSWMYDDWGACDEGTEKKKRTIKCTSNVNMAQVQDHDTCPNADLSFWPNANVFPDPTSTMHQEKQAFKPCVDAPAACTMYAACNGNGNAAMSGGGNSTCQCTCFANYMGDTCDACTDGTSGYPRCRDDCTASDCNGHGTASGNKWKNEFGKNLDNCECACPAGFAGNSCERCANPLTHTYPSCHGSVSPWTMPETTSTELRTTTPPPCYIHRGPIELIPPTGKNWLVINCDVRLRDCTPDQTKCESGIYPTYCAWRNTTDFPAGQCQSANVSATSGNYTYHVKIAGTENDGQNGPMENKSAFHYATQAQKRAATAANGSAAVNAAAAANATAAASGNASDFSNPALNSTPAVNSTPAINATAVAEADAARWAAITGSAAALTVDAATAGPPAKDPATGDPAAESPAAAFPATSAWQELLGSSS